MDNEIYLEDIGASVTVFTRCGGLNLVLVADEPDASVKISYSEGAFDGFDLKRGDNFFDFGINMSGCNPTKFKLVRTAPKTLGLIRLTQAVSYNGFDSRLTRQN